MGSEGKQSQERRRKRYARHRRVRKKIHGTLERPRLCIYRSLKHIYAQVVDDEKGATLVSASSRDAEFLKELKYGANVEAAKVVGRLVAERLKGQGTKEVVFDRGGYLYHGRVKALAEAAREAGLEF
jgi:large subunit ribosomal protein L18